MPDPGPLILGANGRIGLMWQALWRAGAWPDNRRPVWHGRDKADFLWDMTTAPPDTVPPCNGVIVLAGRTAGDETALAQNTTLATAALDLAAKHGLGPVLLCSSSAVYGRATGPQSEGAAAPANTYGAAKRAMERAVADHTVPSCALRIANVAGADAALLNAAKGPVTLDQFDDGQTPRRMYIGPASLLRAMLDLIRLGAEGEELPPILNLARPGLISMGDLLDAAGASWSPKPAPNGALPALTLDLSELSRLLPLSPATPQRLMLEAQLAGWSTT